MSGELLRAMKRVSAVLAVVLAGACAIGLGYELRARSDAGALPDLLNLAPADATFIAYADVTALRQAPLLQQAIALAKPATQDQDYVEFVRATGFDYQRDLDRVLLAGQPSTSPEAIVAVAEGHFDQKRIGDYALRTGKLKKENGRDVYVVPSVTPGKSVALAFLSSDRIAISDGGDYFEKPGAFSPTPLDPTMQERLGRVAGSPFFIAAQTPTHKATDKGSPALFQSLRWLEVAARPDGGDLILSAEGECNSPEEAVKMATALELLRGVAQSAMANPKNTTNMPVATASATQRLLKAASITTTNERVRLLITITPDMIPAPSSATPASR